MKATRNKLDPIIVTNVSGQILKLNSSAASELKGIQIGANIFDIIDADTIRKISMYSCKIDLVSTKLEKYNMAYVKMKNAGMSKTIEISLTNIKEPESVDKDKRIVGLYSAKNALNKDACVDAFETLNTIVQKIAKRKELASHSINIISSDSFYAKIGDKKAELLFMTSIFMLMELCFTSDINIEMTNSGDICFSATSKSFYVAKDAYELSVIHPQIKSKLVLIESICEDENVEMDISKLSKDICLRYKIPTGKKGEMFVKEKSSTISERISVFIDTLLKI